MDKAELGYWLARQLGMMSESGQFEALWKYLEDAYYVGEVENGVSPPEYLLERAREQLTLSYHLAGRTKPSGRAHQAPVEIELREDEKEIASVLSTYLAKHAIVNEPMVQHFQREELDGNLLTPEQAEEFLRRRVERYALAHYEGSLLTPEEIREVLSVDTWSRDELLSRVSEPPPPMPERPIFPDWVQGIMRVTLEEVSNLLAAKYPWTPEQATWFLLTGEPPRILPLRLAYLPTQGTFALSFTPWISEETFRSVYRKVRDYRHKRQNTPPDERTLDVLRFVTECTDEQGRGPSWSELHQLWNREHPEKRYKDRSSLYKAYKRAEQEIAGPWSQRTLRQ